MPRSYTDERLESTLRLQEAWSSIAARHETFTPSTSAARGGLLRPGSALTHALPEAEDDIIDLATLTIVQDRGVLAGTREGAFKIGRFGLPGSEWAPNALIDAGGDRDSSTEDELWEEGSSASASEDELDAAPNRAPGRAKGEYDASQQIAPSLLWRTQHRKRAERLADLRNFLEAAVRATPGADGKGAEEGLRELPRELGNTLLPVGSVPPPVSRGWSAVPAAVSIASQKPHPAQVNDGNESDDPLSIAATPSPSLKASHKRVTMSVPPPPRAFAYQLSSSPAMASTSGGASAGPGPKTLLSREQREKELRKQANAQEQRRRAQSASPLKHRSALFAGAARPSTLSQVGQARAGSSSPLGKGRELGISLSPVGRSQLASSTAVKPTSPFASSLSSSHSQHRHPLPPSRAAAQQATFRKPSNLLFSAVPLVRPIRLSPLSPSLEADAPDSAGGAARSKARSMSLSASPSKGSPALPAAVVRGRSPFKEDWVVLDRSSPVLKIKGKVAPFVVAGNNGESPERRTVQSVSVSPSKRFREPEPEAQQTRERKASPAKRVKREAEPEKARANSVKPLVNLVTVKRSSSVKPLPPSSPSRVASSSSPSKASPLLRRTASAPQRRPVPPRLKSEEEYRSDSEDPIEFISSTLPPLASLALSTPRRGAPDPQKLGPILASFSASPTKKQKKDEQQQQTRWDFEDDSDGESVEIVEESDWEAPTPVPAKAKAKPKREEETGLTPRAGAMKLFASGSGGSARWEKGRGGHDALLAEEESDDELAWL